MRRDIMLIGIILILVGWWMSYNVISVPVTHEIGPIRYTETQTYSFSSLGGIIFIIGIFVFVYGLGRKEKEE